METKINLAPPYIKEKIINHKKLRSVLGMEIAIFAILVVFFIVLEGFIYILDLNKKGVLVIEERGDKSGQIDRMKEYDEEFSAINKQVEDINKIKNDQLYWSSVLLRINESVSSDIEISSLATKNYSVFLAGKADNRESLIDFKDKLEREGCFSNINLPLSNLVSRENIVFQLDFSIKEECLKKK
jgi:hypothetical protein